MALKFTKDEFKGGLKQAAGGKPFFKVEKALKQAGFGKFLRQASVSKDQFRKAVGVLRTQGVVHKQTGEVIRATERKIAAETGPDEKPKEKMSLAEMREQREAEAKKKEEMAKRMALIYGRERAKEADGEGRQKAAVSAALRSTAKTSALERGSKGLGRPETTTSALRRAETKKTEKEERPVAIDLPID
jgi:hypothetical protein